jgi:hypothetical protein
MKADFKRIGRIVGVILLAQALLSIPVYTSFGMMGSITLPDFLTAAAADATKIRTALLLTLLLSAASIAVALVVLPVFRQASERMFWLYFGLSVAGLATTAMESAVIREMLAMSINYSRLGMTQIYDAFAPAVRSEWFSMRFFNLAMGHFKALLFFLILYRFRFIPRVLSGVGVIATVGSTTGTTAALVGVQFSYFMVAPAAIAQLAMTLWLLWKGFSEPVTTVVKST